MLATWQRQSSQNMPEGKGPPSRDRLRRLLDLPTLGDRSAYGASVELAIRHWARSDTLARETVADIDARRLAYIGERVSGTSEPSETQARAFLIYSYLLADAVMGDLLPPAQKEACERLLAYPAPDAGRA